MRSCRSLRTFIPGALFILSTAAIASCLAGEPSGDFDDEGDSLARDLSAAGNELAIIEPATGARMQNPNEPPAAVAVNDPAGEDVSAGVYHTLYLRADGTVLAWGQNSSGQIGTGATSTTQSAPTQPLGLPPIQAVAAGGYFSLALDETGRVWAWGQNAYGQIGTGSVSSTPEATPRQITTLPTIKAIAAGLYHAMAIDTAGNIWVWGNNSYGQMGNGTSGTNVPTPTLVTIPSGAKAISAGWYHSLAVSTLGAVFSWGRNNSGQIGNGSASATTHQTTPYQVALGLSSAKGVAAGGYHSMAVTSSGALWGWGINSSGQLGLSNLASPQNSPLAVPGLTDVAAVAAGGNHSLAMSSGGQVWSFGQDTYGQLGDGDGSATSRATPFMILGLSGVFGVAAGHTHSVALTTGCPVWTWGGNNTAQLGAGGTDAVRHPTPAASLAMRRFYFDSDGDGYGDPSITIEDCTEPPGYVSNNTDCDDLDMTIHPGAAEDCNGFDDDCDPQTGEEGLTSSCYTGPAGSDGVGPCHGGTRTCATGSWGACAGQVLPAPEACDEIDNNCNGTTDEGAVATFCDDGDFDGHGDPAFTIETCPMPPGFSPLCDDCDPLDPEIHPGATEQCNLFDDDCDGLYDEGLTSTCYHDADGDGFGNAAYPIQTCSPPPGCVPNADDCDDSNAAIHPGAAEVCNAFDDDCDAQTDEGVKNTYYRDLDGDGYGRASVTVQACAKPAGYVENSADCNDNDPSTRPGAAEFCNGGDDNCNGLVDDGLPHYLAYFDADGDGVGGWSSLWACWIPYGYVSTSGDCHDNDALAYPGAAERCNSKDDNCNGTVDEGNPGGGQACSTGLPGVCTGGTTVCSQGQVICSQNTQASAEVCDGLDNDCDGAADDGIGSGGSCFTGLPGVCSQGTYQCTGGGWQCVQSVAPQIEECDGLDNDCNGYVDEDYVCGSPPYCDRYPTPYPCLEP